MFLSEGTAAQWLHGMRAKARRELGWEPRPVEESIREAARFWVGLREAKRKSKTVI